MDLIAPAYIRRGMGDEVAGLGYYAITCGRRQMTSGHNRRRLSDVPRNAPLLPTLDPERYWWYKEVEHSPETSVEDFRQLHLAYAILEATWSPDALRLSGALAAPSQNLTALSPFEECSAPHIPRMQALTQPISMMGVESING